MEKIKISNHWHHVIYISERVPYAPIIDGPKNQTVAAGETAIFKCKVVVSDLQPHLQWLKHFAVNGSYLKESGEPFVRVIKVNQLSKKRK